MLLFLLLFTGSALATFLLAFIQGSFNSLIAEALSSPFAADFIQAAFTSAFLEEGFKCLFLTALTVWFKRKAPPKTTRSPITAAVAFLLAFLATENLFYLLNEGAGVFPQRLLVSVPLHAATFFLLLRTFVCHALTPTPLSPARLAFKNTAAFFGAWLIHFFSNFIYIIGDRIASLPKWGNAAGKVDLFCFLFNFVLIWTCLIVLVLSFGKHCFTAKKGDPQ